MNEQQKSVLPTTPPPPPIPIRTSNRNFNNNNQQSPMIVSTNMSPSSSFTVPNTIINSAAKLAHKSAMMGSMQSLNNNNNNTNLNNVNSNISNNNNIQDLAAIAGKTHGTNILTDEQQNRDTNADVSKLQGEIIVEGDDG
jgi:hypothetical protein